ncbi:MAG: cache domain-containing protein [Pseudomonadota bacterium]
MPGLGLMSLKLSVRLKLLILALLPLIVVLPLLLGATMLRWIERFDVLLISKVASDLRVAEQYFHRIESAQASAIAAVVQSVEFARQKSAPNGALDRYLDARRQMLDLDFLVEVDARISESLPNIALRIVNETSPEVPIAGLAVFSASELEDIGSSMAELAAIPLVETQAARRISATTETRGMVLLAAARDPVSGAVLLGGRLLNRNLGFIDAMNALVYRDTGDDSKTRTGTTTLFLDDVRISTNVRLFEGERALGTRVSEVVWQQVMVEGEPWLDRAFVVNDWYISGYVPLTDVAGDRIGMLYTGFLEGPFSRERTSTILTLGLAFLAVLGISAPIFLRLAQGIFSPLEKMTKTMAQVEDGKLDSRIGSVKTNDEIGAVAQHLDRLLDQVEERDEKLRDYAEGLNQLVEVRTEELKAANEKLEATFAQLVMSEKLASVGEITAGVAHELNNPVAVIQGNLEIIRSGLGSDAADYKVEFDLIDAQSHRISTIVQKLLNFTRPGEMSDNLSIVSPQTAVDDALVLVAADLRAHDIVASVMHEQDTPDIVISETELQQVLVNLLINAAQAMEGGGEVRITTSSMVRDGETGAAIEIADDGPGIPPEKLRNVFDPFFTTKLGEGSGLGLSISQALIQNAGGLITAHSSLGEGAVFTVCCPAVDISTRRSATPTNNVDILSEETS